MNSSQTSPDAPQGDLPPDPHLPPSPPGVTSTQSHRERPRTIWVVWDTVGSSVDQAIAFFSTWERAEGYVASFIGTYRDGELVVSEEEVDVWP